MAELDDPGRETRAESVRTVILAVVLSCSGLHIRPVVVTPAVLAALEANEEDGLHSRRQVLPKVSRIYDHLRDCDQPMGSLFHVKP